MSPWITGLIGGAIAGAFCYFSLRKQKAAKISSDGWHTLHPGFLLHGTFALGLALTSLFAYIAVSGGSSRPDAETQNLYLGGLLIVFVSMTIYLWWITYAQKIAWKGQEVRVRNIFGKEGHWQFNEIKSVKERGFRDDCCILFDDGCRVVFSDYLQGSKQLLDRLPKSKFSS